MMGTTLLTGLTAVLRVVGQQSLMKAGSECAPDKFSHQQHTHKRVVSLLWRAPAFTYSRLGPRDGDQPNAQNTFING